MSFFPITFDSIVLEVINNSCLSWMHANSCQSYRTLCKPMECSPPGSFDHGILQARILEWVATPFSRGSSRPRDWTQVSYLHWQVCSLLLAPPVPRDSKWAWISTSALTSDLCRTVQVWCLSAAVHSQKCPDLSVELLHFAANWSMSVCVCVCVHAFLDETVLANDYQQLWKWRKSVTQ